MPRCPGHGRHWFTVHGTVGLRSPVCVRCGAENPRPLTDAEWNELRHCGWPLGVTIATALAEHYGEEPS